MYLVTKTLQSTAWPLSVGAEKEKQKILRDLENQLPVH